MPMFQNKNNKKTKPRFCFFFSYIFLTLYKYNDFVTIKRYVRIYTWETNYFMKKRKKEKDEWTKITRY